MQGVNKGNKTELLKEITEQLGKRKFTIKKATQLLPHYHHPKKLHVLLNKLVNDKKLTHDGKYWQLAEGNMKISTEDFTREFCKGKKLPITATNLSMLLEDELGNSLMESQFGKAIGLIKKALKAYKTNSSSATCPRCSTKMVAVSIEQGRPAFFCTNDRVTLPR